MKKKSNFGRTIGVGERLYVKPSLISTVLLTQKGLRLRICVWVKET